MISIRVSLNYLSTCYLDLADRFKNLKYKSKINSLKQALRETMKATKKPVSQNNVCAIIDAACIFGDVESTKNLQSNFLSLFMSQKEELLSAVAPYLFPFHFNTEFGKWLLEKGWGNSWGLFLTTTSPMEEIRMHFRKFLMVKTEEGKEIYFRFYDPRVLRIFLPTCDEKQLSDFFGPVENYIMEDENPEFAVQFSLLNKKLVTTKITKLEFWSSISNGEDVNLIHQNYIMPLHSKDTTLPKTDTSPNEPQFLKSGWSFLIE